jgi:integrase
LAFVNQLHFRASHFPTRRNGYADLAIGYARLYCSLATEGDEKMPRIKWLAKDIPAKCIVIDGKRTLWQFEGVQNLALDCLANDGDERIWRVRYKVKVAGKPTDRAVVLGQLGNRADQLLPGQARDRRDAIMARVAAGEDPFHVERTKAAEPAGITLAALFADWIEQHAKPKKKTWAEDEALFKRHVAARLGYHTAANVSRLDVSSMLDSVEAKRQSDKTRDTLSAMFNWAMAKGRVESNPAWRQPRQAPKVLRDRVLSDDELRHFWREAGAKDQTQDWSTIFKLQLLLGRRISDVIGMAKDELDLSSAQPRWTIPPLRLKSKKDSPNKRPMICPLPPMALGLVSGIANKAGSALVFPDRNGKGPSTNKSAAHAFPKIGIVGATSHDLRRTAATRMLALKTPPHVVERILDHGGGRGSVLGQHYDANEYFDEKMAALTAWEAELRRIVGL